jgi:hypothetical protein
MHCDRCGAEADANWCEITSFVDPEPCYLFGGAICTTPGCVDVDGSRAVPAPDIPGELTRADRAWLKRQGRLVEEYGRAWRELEEATSGW